MNSPRALWRFFTACLKANAQSALEFRTSLVSQALGMFVSNAMWVVFFVAYFDRFTMPGWGRNEVITLWALASGAFGLVGVLLGNGPLLAGLIARGELDVYLALPKPVLLHVLASKMRLVSIGDVLFAFVAFELTSPTIAGRALFVACIAAGAVVAVSCYVIFGSLAFWLGSAEGLATQMNNALINFSVYPSPIFRGAARVLVHFVIPAAFVVGVPTELLHAPRWELALEEAGAAMGLALAAYVVFHRGLRRYSSGNLLTVRE